jgi:hypothetical protein
MAFSEVREYQIGDEIRTIDWNVTARYNTPFIKVFEEERELTVMLILDVSGSAAFGSERHSKKQRQIEIAATLAFSALSNNDKVGAILANVVILAVQIAIAIKSGNLGAALAKGSNIMKAVSNVAAKVIKGLNDVEKAKNTLMKVNTTVQATGGITQGAMQIDIGVTNIQLANLKQVVQDNKADMSFLTGLIDQTLVLQKQSTSRLTQNLQDTLSQVASYSSFNRSWS